MTGFPVRRDNPFVRLRYDAIPRLLPWLVAGAGGLALVALVVMAVAWALYHHLPGDTGAVDVVPILPGCLRRCALLWTARTGLLTAGGAATAALALVGLWVWADLPPLRREGSE